jgi:PAS domain S-box-containing protein
LTAANDAPLDGSRHKSRQFFNSRREEIIEKQYYEIKNLESKYKKLYEECPVMLRTINLDGVILDCNSTYANSLGYSSKEEVIGHSIFEHTPDDFLHAKHESFEEWRRTGSVKNNEGWMKRKDGTKFPVLLNANNLYDEKGNFIGSNTVITDLTQIFEAKRLQEKAEAQLRRAFELREEFLNVAAHELRTPIQPILGYSQLAERGLITPEVALKGIRESAVRLRDLANDILAVTKIESGLLTYDMRVVEIQPIIDEVINFARMTIQSVGKTEAVTLQTKIADKDARRILLSVDRGRMVQALENILQNSIKFTTKGHIAIETCVLSDKGLYQIRISDTGPGIPSDILPRLFDKFATKAYSDEGVQKGTGLGLFITKAIIQAHNGDIFGYNDEGQGNHRHSSGAVFVIRLPLGDHACTPSQSRESGTPA